MTSFTTLGFVGRFVPAWAGPAARLTQVKIRLGAPNYPGDTMRLTGEVTAVDGHTIEVRVRGANDLGDHVTGTVKLELA